MTNKYKPQKVSLKDLAEELGVSVSTVSRALNGRWEISDSMKKKVEKTAKSMGYRPNRAAKILSSGASDAIGIIVPNIFMSAFSIIVDAMVEVIEKRGYVPMLFSSRDSLLKESQYITNLADMHVCGALVALSQQTKTYRHLDVLRQANIPVCYYGRIPVGQKGIDAVIRSDHRAFYQLTKKLINKGCRRTNYPTKTNKRYITS